MESRLQNIFLSWSEGIASERDFWSNWLATRGAQWPEAFARCVNPNAPFDGRLAAILETQAGANGGKTPARLRVLDVGTGPLFALGHKLPNRELEIVCVDPLAHLYDQLLATNHIDPPVRTRFAVAEDLSSFFPPSYFDIVHCSNALDHSFEPMRGILEMLRCTKVAGSVVLMHARNEALTQDYGGFHQFNCDLVDDQFIIWNRETRISVADEIPIPHTISSKYEDNYIYTQIKKLGEFADVEESGRRDRRTCQVYEEIITALILMSR